MRLVSVLPLTLILAACGGGSSSDGSTPGNADPLSGGANPGGGSSLGDVAKRDCSAGQWRGYSFPMPEYPGYSLQVPVITAPDPEFRFQDVRRALIDVVDAKDDGRENQGPSWSATSNGLTSTINYTNSNGIEIWTLTLDGGPGYDYGNRRNYTVRQLSDCTLEFEGSDPVSAELEVDYSAGREESVGTQYSQGQPSKKYKTLIRSDLSGKAVTARINTGEAHPVSISTWNSLGERTLLETCEDHAGYACVGPATAIAGN